MPEFPPQPGSSPPPSPKRPGFLRVALAVFWSFFGVRKGRDLLADASNIKPQHLIFAGLLGALLLVVSLLLLVRLIIRSTGA
jgi:amino acid transporter